MIISITGHRPPKLGGYLLPNPVYNFVYKELDRLFKELKPEKIISGMALGTDSYAAVVAIRNKIPVIAAVPFLGQESQWPQSSQDTYHQILNKCERVEIISSGTYAPWAMQIRNEWMVDRADEVIAVFDGTSGGTFNCVEYAKKQHKKIHIINPKDFINND